ncbi:MAG: helix-turn-helix transcriptional regulator [Veillonella sp.]|uniref:helix-turn-helix domain-containing protein n=1 Tax=Veillonella sp. TaxID=1926307 RepID=UPI0025F139B0|nr:helix-turn-helix transcriptional regulator [Veillonella sp.]MBS4914085.1 helix-turn-helix transcriptional regulator [Veillonella sp.]
MSIMEQEKRENLKHSTLALASILTPLVPPSPKHTYIDGPNLYRCLGLKIAKIRRQQGLLQRELARYSGISASYLSRIERGYQIQGLTVEILVQLCNALRTELKQIFTFSEDDILQAHYQNEARKLH